MHHRLGHGSVQIINSSIIKKSWDGQNTSYDQIDKINVYFLHYTIIYSTRPYSNMNYLAHTHLRHHRIIMRIREHMRNYAEKEKALNPSYKNISKSQYLFLSVFREDSEVERLIPASK